MRNRPMSMRGLAKSLASPTQPAPARGYKGDDVKWSTAQNEEA